MFSSAKMSFHGITRAAFIRLCERASSRGIEVSGTIGRADQSGVIIQWNYDAASQQLDVECLHTPFWINSAAVERELCSEIESVLGIRSAA
jgi:hypothetical protein